MVQVVELPSQASSVRRNDSCVKKTEAHQLLGEGRELMGSILDVRYTDPPKTYRVRVVDFIAAQGWHKVDSTGLSSWDGEPFKDELHVTEMAANGQIKMVMLGQSGVV